MIAVVDDDNAVREATARLVKSVGYNAFTFASAEDFLKSKKVHDTSCLITDVQMPGLSGLDLQDRLLTNGHRIPIIFITAHPDNIVRARAAKDETVCILAKPFRPDHLLDCVKIALSAA
jgi:FixJ family two-component response regulator